MVASSDTWVRVVLLLQVGDGARQRVELFALRGELRA